MKFVQYRSEYTLCKLKANGDFQHVRNSYRSGLSAHHVRLCMSSTNLPHLSSSAQARGEGSRLILAVPGEEEGERFRERESKQRLTETNTHLFKDDDNEYLVMSKASNANSARSTNGTPHNTVATTSKHLLLGA